MAEESYHFVAAIDKIESAQLSANDQALLTTYVSRSLTRVDAARYVLDRFARESETKTLEDTLLSLKSDLEVLASKGAFMLSR